MKHDALRHDMTSYYAYLPAAFIDQEIELNSQETRNNMMYWWSVEAPVREGRIIRMSMGVSYLHLPFFLAAHATAEPLGHEANGFNAHYYFFILVGSVFYALAGFWLLRKVLLHFFSDGVTAFTLLFIAAGTNLFYYTLSEGPMSHVYNFFLVVVLLYLTIKWHQNPKWGNSILLGFVMGVITLSRPLNVLLAAVPVLYNVYSKETLMQKLVLVQKHWAKVLIAIVFAFLALLPQLLYWHYMSGQWLYYTYGDEGFFFTHPHIIDGLFSYRKGWLLYTPLMALALLGFVVVWKQAKQWAFSLWLVVPVFVWCVYSWWTWWYGGSFGSRPMIDIYGLLAIPLAALLSSAIKQKTRWAGATFLLLGAFFVYLNIYQTYQYKKAMIHWDSMTKQAYWAVFLKKHYPENYSDLIKTPDYEKAKRGEDEY